MGLDLDVQVGGLLRDRDRTHVDGSSLGVGNVDGEETVTVGLALGQEGLLAAGVRIENLDIGESERTLDDGPGEAAAVPLAVLVAEGPRSGPRGAGGWTSECRERCGDEGGSGESGEGDSGLSVSKVRGSWWGPELGEDHCSGGKVLGHHHLLSEQLSEHEHRG